MREAQGKTVGDNYGETCLDCDETLAGFGENAREKHCQHGLWASISETEEQCGYCEMVRRKLE